jgi:hypothetical protein
MEREWRRKKCVAILNVEHGARLHLRYKQAQYVKYRPDDLVASIDQNNAQSAAHQGGVR